MLEHVITQTYRIILAFLSIKPVRIAVYLSVACIIAYTLIAKVTDVLSPWSSESKVRQRLLALTPIGSSKDKVKSVLQSEHWRICYEKKLFHTAKDYPGVKGTYAIGADLGQHFGLPFPYGADAYWGFDETGKMIDLNVRVNPLGL